MEKEVGCDKKAWNAVVKRVKRVVYTVEWNWRVDGPRKLGPREEIVFEKSLFQTFFWINILPILFAREGRKQLRYLVRINPFEYVKKEKARRANSREDNFFSDENGDPFRNTGNA